MQWLKAINKNWSIEFKRRFSFTFYWALSIKCHELFLFLSRNLSKINLNTSQGREKQFLWVKPFMICSLKYSMRSGRSHVGESFFLDVCEMKCDEMCFRPTLRRWHEANTKITQASDSIGILNTIPTLQNGTPSFYLKRVIYWKGHSVILWHLLCKD